MAYPEIPSLSYSYTGFQQSQGDFSFPGTSLDNDLALIRGSIASIVEFLQLLARSDGKLGAGTVTKAALDASLLLGVGSPTSWTTAVAYKDGDTVVTTNKLYVAKANHTSGVFATDLAAGKWLLLADFTSFTLADGSVSEPKLATGSGSSRVLADLGVLTAKIAALAVTEPKLADGAASTRVIADGALTEAKYANLSVSTPKLQDLSVSTPKLGDKAVTKAKMADVGGQRVVGNGANVAGVPADLSVTNILDWLSNTQGSVLYRGSAGWAALAPGAAGTVLKSNGAGADPTFGTLSAGGTVTSVGTGGGLTGGPITGAGTVALDTSLGAIGSYAVLQQVSGSNTAHGSSTAGSNLRYSSFDGTSTGTAVTGTWMNKSGFIMGVGVGVGLWQRVS